MVKSRVISDPSPNKRFPCTDVCLQVKAKYESKYLTELIDARFNPRGPVMPSIGYQRPVLKTADSSEKFRSSLRELMASVEDSLSYLGFSECEKAAYNGISAASALFFESNTTYYETFEYEIDRKLDDIIFVCTINSKD